MAEHKNNIPNPTIKTHAPGKTRKIAELITDYKIITLKLQKHAQCTPCNKEETAQAQEEQNQLQDRQQGILTQAANMEISNIDDLVGMMKLWHLDEIRSVNDDDISAGQLLAVYALKHLMENKHHYHSNL